MNDVAIDAAICQLEGLAALCRVAYERDALEFINYDHVDDVLGSWVIEFTFERMRDELAEDRSLMETSEQFDVEDVDAEVFYDDEYVHDDEDS